LDIDQQISMENLVDILEPEFLPNEEKEQ